MDIVETRDPDTGRMCFFNAADGKSGWTRSDVLDVAAAPPPPAPAAAPAPAVEELEDPGSGRTCFHNPASASGRTGCRLDARGGRACIDSD